MRHIIPLALFGAMCVTGLAQDAGDPSKKTEITVNEAVLVPGKELPPGKYVLKLLNATANRHVVQIYNEDQTQLQATILAFPNERVQRTGDTVLTYWETPAGTPPAIRAWFFPGDTWGQEFAYPKEMADRISRANNNAQVPNYQGDLKADQLSAATVQNEPAAPRSSTTPGAAAARAATPSPAPSSTTTAPASNTVAGTPAPAQRETPVNTAATQSDSSRSARPVGARNPDDETRPPAITDAQRDAAVGAAGRNVTTAANTATNSTAGTADRAASNDVLAQNRPPATAQPTTPNAQPAAGAAELPHTASNGPIWMLCALVAFACALTLRFTRV